MQTIKKVVVLNFSIFRICDFVTYVILHRETNVVQCSLTCFSHGTLDLLEQLFENIRTAQHNGLTYVFGGLV